MLLSCRYGLRMASQCIVVTLPDKKAGGLRREAREFLPLLMLANIISNVTIVGTVT